MSKLSRMSSGILCVALVGATGAALAAPPAPQPAPAAKPAQPAAPAPAPAKPAQPAAPAPAMPSEQAAPTPTEAREAAPQINDSQIAYALLMLNAIQGAQAEYAKSLVGNVKMRKYAEQVAAQQLAETSRFFASMPQMGVAPGASPLSDAIGKQAKETAASMQAMEGNLDKAYAGALIQQEQRALAVIDKVLLPNVKDPQLKAQVEATRARFATQLHDAQEIQRQL